MPGEERGDEPDDASATRPEPGHEPGHQPDDEPSPEAIRRRRRELILLLTPLSVAVVAGWVAGALTPTLLAKSPLTLVALDPSNRNLVLTASLVDPLPYYLVAVGRLLLVDPFTYVLGVRYGDDAVRWIERRFTSLKPTVEWLESIFRRAAPLAVAIAPGAIMCTLAGAVGMRIWVFALSNITGSVVRVAVLRVTGGWLEGPVGALRGFFDRYIVLTTLASAALVALWLLYERRQGAAETETPGELADELEHEIEHRPDPGPADESR